MAEQAPGEGTHLGDRDGLLLHGLVDCHTVILSHLCGREGCPPDPDEGAGAQQQQKTLQELMFLNPHSVPANGRNQVTSSRGDKVWAWLISPLSRFGEVYYVPVVMGGLYLIKGGFCHSDPQPTAARCHQH